MQIRCQHALLLKNWISSQTGREQESRGASTFSASMARSPQANAGLLTNLRCKWFGLPWPTHTPLGHVYVTKAISGVRPHSLSTPTISSHHFPPLWDHQALNADLQEVKTYLEQKRNSNQISWLLPRQMFETSVFCIIYPPHSPPWGSIRVLRWPFRLRDWVAMVQLCGGVIPSMSEASW